MNKNELEQEIINGDFFINRNMKDLFDWVIDCDTYIIRSDKIKQIMVWVKEELINITSWNIEVTIIKTLDWEYKITYWHIKKIKEHMLDISELINVTLDDRDLNKLDSQDSNQNVLQELFEIKDRSLEIKTVDNVYK